MAVYNDARRAAGRRVADREEDPPRERWSLSEYEAIRTPNATLLARSYPMPRRFPIRHALQPQVNGDDSRQLPYLHTMACRSSSTPAANEQHLPDVYDDVLMQPEVHSRQIISSFRGWSCRMHPNKCVKGGIVPCSRSGS